MSLVFLMRGSRKFCQRGSNFDNVFLFVLFLVNEGWEGRNTTTSAGHHQPASETTFKWRFAGVLMMAQH